ncbi:MAG TPA: hypothetical protein VKA55_03220 [Gammaproteobacteria bacterium]|nr:hypothetical protein [Gammaproteobacteria bacterium]
MDTEFFGDDDIRLTVGPEGGLYLRARGRVATDARLLGLLDGVEAERDAMLDAWLVPPAAARSLCHDLWAQGYRLRARDLGFLARPAPPVRLRQAT